MTSGAIKAKNPHYISYSLLFFVVIPIVIFVQYILNISSPFYGAISALFDFAIFLAMISLGHLFTRNAYFVLSFTYVMFVAINIGVRMYLAESSSVIVGFWGKRVFDSGELTADGLAVLVILSSIDFLVFALIFIVTYSVQKRRLRHKTGDRQ